MSIHYCFIGRDTDMIVFENILNKDLNRPIVRDCKELMSDFDNFHE